MQSNIKSILLQCGTVLNSRLNAFKQPLVYNANVFRDGSKRANYSSKALESEKLEDRQKKASQ